MNVTSLDLTVVNIISFYGIVLGVVHLSNQENTGTTSQNFNVVIDYILVSF